MAFVYRTAAFVSATGVHPPMGSHYLSHTVRCLGSHLPQRTRPKLYPSTSSCVCWSRRPVRCFALGITVGQFAMRVLNRSFQLPAQHRNVDYYESFHVQCISGERADVTYKQGLSLKSYDPKFVRLSRGDLAKMLCRVGSAITIRQV
jgi:hypothetical protein